MPTGTRVLEVGCGRNRDPRATHRIDANPNVFTREELVTGTHVIGDATELPWPDQFFDTVLAIDVLEHIGFRHTLRTLREWRRVCKGRVYVQVPDAGTIMRQWLNGGYRHDPRRPKELPDLPMLSAAWRILGGQDDGDYAKGGDDWTLNLHCAMFDEPTLRWFLHEAGFTVETVETNSHPNLCAWASTDRQ